MKKFPVTSKNGVVYEVELGPDVDFFNEFCVVLYARYIGIFGINRKRTLRVGYYDAENWGFNYVEMARAIVIEYEKSIADKLRQERVEAEGIAAFTDWDGKC